MFLSCLWVFTILAAATTQCYWGVIGSYPLVGLFHLLFSAVGCKWLDKFFCSAFYGAHGEDEWLWLLGVDTVRIALLITAIAVVVYFLVKRKEEKKEDNSNENSLEISVENPD